MDIMNFFKGLFGKRKVDLPSLKKPSSSAKVCFVKRDFHVIKNEKDLQEFASKVQGSVLKGRTLDLKGAILDGKNLKGDGGQNENQDPMIRIQLDNVTITNGFCRNVKDGIRVDANNVSIIKMYFLDVGEDAVSNGRGATNTKVLSCEFNNTKNSSADKSIQLNDGKGAIVDRCIICGGITGIRMGETYNSSNDVGAIKNTKFYNVDTAINLAKIKVKLDNNSYNGVRLEVKHSHGSKII